MVKVRSPYRKSRRRNPSGDEGRGQRQRQVPLEVEQEGICGGWSPQEAKLEDDLEAWTSGEIASTRRISCRLKWFAGQEAGSCSLELRAGQADIWAAEQDTVSWRSGRGLARTAD